jgi:hypothetical protein
MEPLSLRVTPDEAARSRCAQRITSGGLTWCSAQTLITSSRAQSGVARLNRVTLASGHDGAVTPPVGPL